MSDNLKQIFENRVTLDEVQDNDCDSCESPLVFALKKGDQTFSVDLFTILNCLKFAEKENCIPTIPNDWWLRIVRHYNGKVDL